MAEPWADKFYKSKRWQKCRKGYVEIMNGICEVCGDIGSEVHHVIELTRENVSDPMIALNYENFQLLCHSCHDKTKKNRLGAPIREDVRFDEMGNLIEREDTPPDKFF